MNCHNDNNVEMLTVETNKAINALNNKKLLMNKSEKKQFLINVKTLMDKYAGKMSVSTNDPLLCLVTEKEVLKSNEKVVLNGCSAGSVTFCVNYDGTIVPCNLLDIPIMNITNMNLDEIAHNYTNSLVVKNLIDMNLEGKCGSCKDKYSCCGCRARAHANGNYLGEDPDCWRGEL